MMAAMIKRALYCRWFHRWRMPRRVAAPVVSRDPSGSGQALVLSAGPHRNYCDACADTDYGSRAYKRWCAS